MNPSEPKSSQNPQHPIGTVAWLSGAFKILKNNMQVWFLAGGVMMVALFLTISLQWVGQVVLSLLTPVFIGGLILGAAESDNGQAFTVKTLSAAFTQSNKFKRLVLLGCFLLIFYVSLVAISLGLYLALGGDTVIDELQKFLQNQLSVAEQTALFEQLMPLLVLGILVLFIYFLASFFSIPHVALRDADAFQSLILSVVCSFRHIGSIVGVCLAIFSITVVASILLLKTELALIFMLVVIWPFTVCVQYVAYRSVFGIPGNSDSIKPDNETDNDATLKA